MQGIRQIERLKHNIASNKTCDYKAYTLHNLDKLPQIDRLSAEQRHAVEVVAQVLPFKTNRYVTEELIDWDNIPNDPLFILNFPQHDMLKPHHFNAISNLLKTGASRKQIQETANHIRMELNPHPAGQMQHNIPTLDEELLHGVQHKYRETVLFFPSQGQACHAYCSFCFRWPQFVGISNLRFASREVERLTVYLQQNPQVTDVLFTGGDPLVMQSNLLASYILPLLDSKLPNLQTIRIGTKALSYWPYRFLSDPDSKALLHLFQTVKQSGKHLALMAHFNHPRELQTRAAQQAIARIQETGAQIRTQSPLLSHINDDPRLWSQMWREQVKLGCVPYYMFVVRDTGAQHYFGLPLVNTWKIYREAYQNVSGIARTVRGPVMSAHPGKCQVLGVQEIDGKKVLSLRFLQGRNPDWVLKPFFAAYDDKALWLSDLKPAFGQKNFFFEEDLHESKNYPYA